MLTVVTWSLRATSTVLEDNICVVMAFLVEWRESVCREVPQANYKPPMVPSQECTPSLYPSAVQHRQLPAYTSKVTPF